MAIFDKPTKDRPKVDLKTTWPELAVEALAQAGIAINLLLFVYYWPKLPEVATSVARTGLNRSPMFVTLLPMIIYLGATARGFFPVCSITR